MVGLQQACPRALAGDMEKGILKGAKMAFPVSWPVTEIWGSPLSLLCLEIHIGQMGLSIMILFTS